MIQSFFSSISFFVHSDFEFPGLAFWCPIIVPAKKVTKTKDGKYKFKHGSDIISLMDNKFEDLNKKLDDWILTVAKNYDTKEKKILLKYNLKDKTRTVFNMTNPMEFNTKRINGTKRVLSESFYIFEYWVLWEDTGVKAIDSFIVGEMFDIVTSCSYWPLCQAFIYRSMVEILIENGIYDPDPDKLYHTVGDSEWEKILMDAKSRCDSFIEKYIDYFPATNPSAIKDGKKIILENVDRYDLMDSVWNIEQAVENDFRRFKSLDVMSILNQDRTLYNAISDSILDIIHPSKKDYTSAFLGIKDMKKKTDKLTSSEYFSIEFMNKIMEEGN